MSEPGTVGIVGDAPGAADAAEDGGATVVTGSDGGAAGDDAAADLADAAAAVVDAAPDLAVAAGEPALLALVRAGVEAPVLPVAAGRGVRSVPRDAAGAAVEAALGGDGTPADASTVERLDHPLYGVSVDGERAARVLTDAGLLAEEPAHISEFSVRTPDGTVARFRADGVVVGTPAGSHGYLAAAGGPVLQPGAGVVGVAPVARFSTARDRWVLRPAGLALAVEREETPVSLVADDRTVRQVAPGERVTFEREGTLRTVVVEQSQPFFG